MEMGLECSRAAATDAVHLLGVRHLRNQIWIVASNRIRTQPGDPIGISLIARVANVEFYDLEGRGLLVTHDADPPASEYTQRY